MLSKIQDPQEKKGIHSGKLFIELFTYIHNLFAMR